MHDVPGSAHRLIEGGLGEILPRFDNTLRELLDQGGPRPSEYEALDHMIDVAWGALQEAEDAGELAASRIRGCFGPEFLRETVHGHGLSKPFGYAGDFLMIDKIYMETISPFAPFQRWDEYFQSDEAPTSVRGRKQYFQQLVGRLAPQVCRPHRVLILGTRPGRDIAELIQRLGDAPIHITSVNLDPRASAYARQVIGRDEARVRFTNGNALRFMTEERFDLIWSAGLFDYLNDRLFVGLLRRFARFLVSGGRLVVGDFSLRKSKSTLYGTAGRLARRSPPRVRSAGRWGAGRVRP